MKRTVFHVYFSKERERWETSVAGMVVFVAAVGKAKASYVPFMRRWCVALWENDGVPCELVVHNKGDGKITAKGRSTYGNDPKDTKG